MRIHHLNRGQKSQEQCHIQVFLRGESERICEEWGEAEALKQDWGEVLEVREE
jgi:hypothetical protein